MKKKFLTNLIFLLFVNLLIKPFWIFGIDRTVQNTVGANDYGFYFSLFSFSILLNIILDAGITNYNNRNIAMHQHMLSKYLSNIVSIKAILAAVYILVSFSVGLAIGYNMQQFKLLFLLAFNQVLASFILYLRSNISGLHLFKTDSILSVLDRFLMIIICSSLLWGNIIPGEFKIEWFVYAQTLSYSLTTIISLILVIRKAEWFKPRFNIIYLRLILRESYPFALLVLLMSFYNRIDSVMIERMLTDGKVQAGVYAQGFRILDAAAAFALLFAGLLLPIFSRMIKEKENILPIVRMAFELLIIPSLILAVVSWFYSREIMDLLYPMHVNEAAPIYALLMSGFVFISLSYIFGTLLTAGGNLKALNSLAAFTLILNVGLNFLLIPKLAAQGSAIASLSTQMFSALLQIWLCFRIFQLKIKLKQIFRFLLFLILVVCAGFLLKVADISATYGILLLFAAGLSAAVLVGFLNVKSAFAILKPVDKIKNHAE